MAITACSIRRATYGLTVAGVVVIQVPAGSAIPLILHRTPCKLYLRCCLEAILAIGIVRINFLRAALASGTTLTNAWAARPNWEFHPMAIGYPIGYCARLTQNNAGYSYVPGFGNRQVHVALMGDPTLRMHMVAPPTDLSIVEENGHAVLSWEAAPDALSGYNIYRKRSVENMYELVNPAPVSATSFTDSCLVFGESYDYYVKSVKLETSASGTYFNESLGVPGNIEILTDNTATADFEINESGPFEYEMINNSANATSYFWQFGDLDSSTDAEPVFFAGQTGMIEITLIAFGDCNADTISQVITVLSTVGVHPYEGTRVHPNPATNLLFVDCPNCTGAEIISIRSVDGRMLLQLNIAEMTNGLMLETFNPGYYLLEIQGPDGTGIFPFIRLRE